MEVSSAIYTALELKYRAEIQASKATLMIYFNNTVAIGEHPQHLKEMDDLLETMSVAQAKIINLNKYFSNYCKDNVSFRRASP